MDSIEALRRDVRRLANFIGVFGTLLLLVLAFLAVLKDRELDGRTRRIEEDVRSLKTWKDQQLQWNKDLMEFLRSK